MIPVDRLRRFTAFAALTGVVLSGCAAGPFRERPEVVHWSSAATLLPVLWQGSLPLLSVAVDGKGPYSFLLDTGSNATIVSPAVAERHPSGTYALEAPVSLHAPGDEQVAVHRIIRADCVTIGTVEFRGLDALIVPLDPVSLAVGTTVDGILGASAFSGGALVLDYPQHRVSFGAAGLDPPDGVTVLPLTTSPVPQVPCQLGAARILLVLDSGSAGGLRLASWPADSRFIVGPAEGRAFVGLAGVQSDEASGRVFGDLVLGSIRIRNPAVAIGSGSPRLGAAVLRHFKVTLDLARGRLVLDGSERTVQLESLRWSGIAIGVRGAHIVVEHVVPGSGGDAAGVRESDEVLRVNGAAVDPTCVASLREQLQGDAAAVRLALLRNGREIEVDVPLVVMN